MKKLILAVFMALTVTSAVAYEPTDRWVGGDRQVQEASKYWTDRENAYTYWYDENGIVRAWRRPQTYRDWTYVDSDLIDYTIKIIIE